MKNRNLNRILAVSIVLAVIAAYWTSFSGVFLFDDFGAIFRNENVVGPVPVFWGHRWLVDLSFRFNLRLFGPDTLSFHAVNLGIHVLNALLVFVIVKKAASRFRQSGGEMSLMPSVLGWGTGLLWGVHPLTTQAVTYICQRYESMTALCLLAALYCFVSGISSQRKERIWLDLSLIMLLLGMGTKESIAVAPVFFLAYDYVFWKGPFSELVRRRGLFHIASFATTLVLLMNQVILAAKQISGTHEGARLGAAGPLPYLYSQATVILHYIKISIWPDSLCFDYSWQLESLSLMGVLAFVLHVALFGLSSVALLRRKVAGLLGFAFYMLLATTSSVIPVADIAVEHRMYAPLIVLVLIALLGLKQCLSASLKDAERKMLRMAFGLSLISVAAAVPLGMATSVRNLYYSSQKAMWADVCAKRPDNLRARNDLASALSEAGMTDAALTEYYEVISRVPATLRLQCDRGRAMVFGRFVKSSPKYAYFVACANLGTMYCNELHDYDAAFEWYLKALAIAPANTGVRVSAKNILRAFGHEAKLLDEELNKAIHGRIRSAINEEN